MSESQHPGQHVVEAEKPTKETMNESHEITADSDSDTNQDGNAARRSSNANGNDKLGSGHYDTIQRQLYLGLQTFSLATALMGLLLLSIWIFKYRTGISFTDTMKFGNLHALFMYTFMVGLNAYGVLVYRTFYSAKKETLKWAHAALSFVNIVMAISGVTFMFISHNAKNEANLYTLHSWIGLTTTTLYVSQFIFGFVAFLKPGLSKSIRATSMPLHRFMGVALLCMAGLAAITGITEWVIFTVKDYNRFIPITYIANFTGICVLVSTLVSAYLLTQDKYRRPDQPEHQFLSGKGPE